MQTCVEEVENAEYVAPLKPLLSMRVEDPVDEELDPRSRLREYVDSKRKLVAKKLCYAKPTRSSWPLKQGRMGDLSQLKEDLEQKITTWQREVDLKLMKSVWGAHVRTPVTRSRGGPATGRCGDTHRWTARQGTTLTRASIRLCHVTKRFRILATLPRGNKSMYNNTSGYVHMGLRLDWGKGITGQ